MDKNITNTLPGNWSDLICTLSANGKSIAIGLFNTNGKLLYANSTMCYFLNTTSNELQPKNFFVNPQFDTFLEGNGEGKLFEGYMTIGNYSDISFVLLASVFRQDDQILVFAEPNVPELFNDNNKMSELNQQINNLQRQLIKEKKTIEKTLDKLRETQQMLIHSEKMNALGKLVAGVAHELNNPISFVYSNLFTLEKYINEVYESYKQVEGIVAEKGSEELVAEIDKIRIKNEVDFLMEDIADMARESKVGVERVKTIVEDLRRFSRLDESEIKQIDLIENIRSTVSIAMAEINKKNIAFELIGPENLTVECYPGQLNQAILNVLINAIQAVAEGGQVSLTTTKFEENIIILVKDNGCGIPEEIKQRIFEPFFTTKPMGSGTGLGLSITYKIVSELHKGSIQVESEINRGTTFTITIPINITNE